MSERRAHRRRRDPGRRRPPTRADDGLAVPGWLDWCGERMYVVDFTSGGFPIGIREQDAPEWLEER